MNDRYAKMKAAFEKWQSQSGVAAIYEGDGQYEHHTTQREWMDWQDAWQAATEAAKATGTAGELSEDAILNLAKAHGFTTTQILSRGPELIGGSVELHERFIKFGQACAEAARQPAPAPEIMTWQDRMREAGEPAGYRHIEQKYIAAEIADLRAALSATNQR